MEYDIRPREGISPIAAIGMRYGDQRAKGIVEAGAQIEEGLQRVTTTRQLQGLGQTLSQLDPRSADYPQKLVAIAPNFPLAMKDPRGQALMSLGVKDHFQWQQTEAAKSRMATGFQNQKDLVSFRAANRPAAEKGVDLTGMFGDTPLPASLSPQNPATGIDFGTDETHPNTVPETAGGNIGNAANIDPEGALLPPVDFQPVGKPSSPGTAPIDPLVKRALRPLYDAGKDTGVLPKPREMYSAIASERTRAQQEKLQEDRQAQQDKTLATKAKEAESKAVESAQRAEEKAQKASKMLQLQRDRADANRAIAKAREALNKHLVSAPLPEDRNDAFYAKKAQLEGQLERAGAEATKLAEGETSTAKKLRYDPATGSLVPQ